MALLWKGHNGSFWESHKWFFINPHQRMWLHVVGIFIFCHLLRCCGSTTTFLSCVVISQLHSFGCKCFGKFEIKILFVGHKGEVKPNIYIYIYNICTKVQRSSLVITSACILSTGNSKFPSRIAYQPFLWSWGMSLKYVTRKIRTIYNCFESL